MRSTPIASKEKLLEWVNDQRELDPTSKFILYRLAQFADAECCAWSRVETLAEAVNVSDRTVQLRLRKFEEDGLIERTGRTHVIETKKGPREVPIYQLAGRVEGLGLKQHSGENSSPESGVGVKNSGHSGEAVFTPHNELRRTEVRPNGLTASERAREARFDEADGAYPQSGRSVTDYPKARQVWLSVTAQVDPDALIAAIRRYAVEDRTLRKGDHGAPAFEKWLAAERWRAWLTAGVAADGGVGAVMAAAPAACAFDGPPDLRDDFVESFGAERTAAYLDPCRWDGERRALMARTGVAVGWLTSTARWWLRKHGLTAERFNEKLGAG